MATEDPVVPTADPAPALEKSKKVKKTPAKAKPRTPSLHPPYLEMIKEALVTLKERTGSSQYAIAKFIEENQKNLPANFKKVLLTQLKKLVAAGKLVKVKASYKLPPATAPAKKKPVSKPKTVKKVTPAKKKTVAKPKPKAAAKPKPAAKTKAVAKPAVKAKAAATKAKPKAKAKAPAKVARISKKSTPSKKGLKPKAAIAKKASGAKKVNK